MAEKSSNSNKTVVIVTIANFTNFYLILPSFTQILRGYLKKKSIVSLLWDRGSIPRGIEISFKKNSAFCLLVKIVNSKDNSHWCDGLIIGSILLGVV